MIRLVVADDDALAGRMISDRLATDDVQVLAVARDGDEAVEAAVELAPDIMVMDLLMPGCDGIAATRRIAVEAPDVKVVILSVRSDQEAIMLALRAGAVGYVDKAIEMDALLRVVRGVYRGEAGLDRLTTRALIDEYQAMSARSQAPAVTATQSAGSVLSPRQQEILELLAADMSTEAIAADLNLAIETVRTHIKAILRKLRVHSRREAVTTARGRGLVLPSGGGLGEWMLEWTQQRRFGRS